MTARQSNGFFEYMCQTCNTFIRLTHPFVIHSGFNETGFMYCDECGKVATWSIYDQNFKAISDSLPWKLSNQERQVVEASIVNCNCGGRFSFSAKPRCQNCKTIIPVDKEDIYYYVINEKLDGEKKNIWKNKLASG